MQINSSPKKGPEAALTNIIFGRMSARISGPKLSLWAGFFVPENIRNQDKGDFRRFFFANMYASLGCGALSAKRTAGSNILVYSLFSLA